VQGGGAEPDQEVPDAVDRERHMVFTSRRSARDQAVRPGVEDHAVEAEQRHQNEGHAGRSRAQPTDGAEYPLNIRCKTP